MTAEMLTRSDAETSGGSKRDLQFIPAGDRSNKLVVFLRYSVFAIVLLTTGVLCVMQVWNYLRINELQIQMHQLQSDLVKLRHLFTPMGEDTKGLLMNGYEEDSNDEYEDDYGIGTESDAYNSTENPDNEYEDGDGELSDFEIASEPIGAFDLKDRPNLRKTRSIQSSDQPKEVTGKVLQEAEFSNNIASNAQTPPKSSDHFATERGSELGRFDNMGEQELRPIDHAHRPKSRRHRIKAAIAEASTADHNERSGSPNRKRVIRLKANKKPQQLNVKNMRKRMAGRHLQQLNNSARATVHYVAELLHGNTGIDKGNGLFEHQGQTYTNWRPAHWTVALGSSRYFALDHGVVTVLEDGVYQVYAQIYYHNRKHINSYSVLHNDSKVMQCATTAHYTDYQTHNTCFTFGLVHIRAGDTIRISDTFSHVDHILAHEKSFFGLVRVGGSTHRQIEE